MQKWKNKSKSIMALAWSVVLLLLFYAIFDLTSAYLFTSKQTTQEGTSNLGSVGSSITSTTADYTVALPSAGTNISLAEYSKITNTGLSKALLRVFYSVSINQELKQIATTDDFSMFNLNETFIGSNENINNVYSGYYYYNEPIDAGATVSLINTVTPTDTVGGKTVKINMIAEFVNYIGGPYQLGQMLPWNNTPARWFMSNASITKPSGTTVTPRFDIGFKDVSRIELTAKCPSFEDHTLFSEYNGGYISVNAGASVWDIGGGISGTADISKPADFFNGKFNTINFYITSCTTDKEYFTTVYNSKWSREISYKQIRVWNKANELVYDYQADESGRFYDAVSGKIVPYYVYTGGLVEYDYENINGNILLHRHTNTPTTPKLTLPFREISKIELTAMTEAFDTNFTLFRSGDDHISHQTNKTAWDTNVATASMTPSEFFNGNLNTVTFQISTSNTTATDTTFTWDAAWSQEIYYKQVRIWNKSNVLVYDLVPNASGLFVNNVNNEILPMYLDSELLSENKPYYQGTFIYEGFEDGDISDIKNYFGVTSSISTNARTGTKSLLVKSADIEDVTGNENQFPNMIHKNISLKAGSAYTISLWYKTDAPDGAMAYAKDSNTGLLKGFPLTSFLKVDGVDQYSTTYNYSGGWELLSITTPVLSADTTAPWYIFVPTGSTYNTYIDDIIVVQL